MIIYNVTLKVQTDAVDAWVKWMKEEHMPDVLSLGIFTESRLCHLLEQEEDDGVTFAAQYFCNTYADYQSYIDNHSNAMREKGLKAFAGKFVAFRTVMEII